MARSVFRFRQSPSVVAGLLAIALSIAPLGAAMAPTAATGDEPQLLFRLQAADKADVLPQRGAAAAERVAVDRLLLDREPQRLAFDLLDGRRTALADGLERRGAGDLTWRGWLDEGSDKAIGIGRVVLTLHRGHLVGAIFTAEGTYELAPLPPGPGDGGSVGGTVLKLLDPELLPGCGLDPRSHSPAVAALLRRAAEPVPAGGDLPGVETTGGQLPEPALLARDSASQIDLLGLYTPQVRTAAGSAGAAAATVQAAVDVANTAFRDSRLGNRYRLVHIAQAPFGDSGDMSFDLFQLATSGAVGQLRDRHLADLVGLLVEDGQYCGIGMLPTRFGTNANRNIAFQVTARACAVGNMTYAHEHGHNLGLHHDPANAGPPNELILPYAYGHFVDGLFRTVMSYPNECSRFCQRVPHFSSPEVLEFGQPTGIADQRDNRRVIGRTAGMVANYRSRPTGPAAPGELAVERRRLTAELAWVDNAGDEDAYRVYRKTDGGSAELIAELPAGSDYHRDETLAAGTTFSYQVASVRGGAEGKSGEVELVVPAAEPVTVRLGAQPGAAYPAGEEMTLVAVVTGPVEEAVWRIGDDGLALSRRPCDADRFCAPFLPETAGPLAVEVEVVGDVGQTATASGTVAVAGDAALVRREAVVQSVLFARRGNTGTFESDCWLANGGAEVALAELTYLPRGLGNPDPERRRVALPPDTALYLPNVVATLFGEDDSQGAVGLAYLAATDGAAAAVRGHCRSFVALAGKRGSFGQLVGEERDGNWSAAPKTVPGILEDPGFTTTLLAVNLDDVPGRVTIELIDAAGVAVGEPAVLGLGRRTQRFRPLSQLFPEAAERTGPFTARFSADGIRFAGSATLLENISEDQIFIAAREQAGAGRIVVPRIARSASQFDSFLVSRLVAHNPSTTTTELTFELWERGQVNLEPRTARRTVGPGESLLIEDLVMDLYELEEAVGALAVSWVNPQDVAPQVLTYSLNEQGAGGQRFGMLVDGIEESAAAQTSAFDFGAEQSEVFKADFGVVNLNDGATRIELTLRDEDGAVIATSRYTLSAQQHFERNMEGVFRDLTLGSGANWRVETRVLGGGPVITYLANTNVSGDVFFVPGRAVE